MAMALNPSSLPTLAALRLVQDLRDAAEAHRTAVLYSIETRGLAERERALLLRECRPIANA